MEKLVYALWGVHEGLVEKAGPELLALDPHGLTVNVVDPDVDMSAVVGASDGERSPGVKQITMFDKRPDIDDVQFFSRWHGSHTPLTFEVHPVCLYVRHA